MKNADLPAMPQAATQKGFSCANCVETGLTKREMFAMHAMQGILSGNSLVELANVSVKNSADDAGDIVASMAVNAADTLLAELDK